MKKLLAIILATLVILTLVAGCAKSDAEAPAPPQPLADPIKTEYGLVSGGVITEAGSEIHVYKGIPYAAPPLGDLRWKPPQPPAPWEGVREMTEYSIGAPQNSPFGPSTIEQSEDCLYLNVMTPAEYASDKLPVMVWMHGGAYSFLTGNDAVYNLPGLPAHGVVLVTVNTRLDLLGLLAHPLLSAESPQGVSGNYIFLDMIAALEWVRTNIAAFGGDPDSVTIFGQSGGGFKVANLMASPLAKGLFHKAILESGTTTEGYYPGKPLKDIEAMGQDIFASLGVDKAADPLAAARALPWEDIVGIVNALFVDAAVDGWFLPEPAAEIFKAGRQNPVPFITVINRGEITGRGPLLMPQLIPGYTDMLANAGKAGVKGYAAVFERVPDNWKAEGSVAVHGIEVSYVFGDMDPESEQWLTEFGISVFEGVTNPDPGLTEVDRQLSENMMQMWTQFARTGNPSIPSLAEWPAYDAASDKYLSLDVPLQVNAGFSLIAPEEPAPSPTPEPSPDTSPGEAGEGPAYTWEEAKNHVGETATVTGPIIDSIDLLTSGGGDNIVLGMGKGALELGAVGIELAVDRAQLPADLYKGKIISATGKIYSNPMGGVSVLVDDLSQIEIIE
jgi:para-nitrobenzyl esterase